MTFDTVLILIILFSGFYMAWNIGANDVANAMGTSVGSGSLTLKQAVLIAALLEFCGAYFFGSHVTKTLQEGIVRSDIFQNRPYDFVYGMLASLLGAGLWLQIATYFGLPVSTTHSIVGAIVGFGAVVGGLDGVYWSHVFSIALSWVLSPICGCALSFLFFLFLRRTIFYAKVPLQATKKRAPLFAFMVAATFSLVLVSESLVKVGIRISFKQDIFISCLIGALASLFTWILVKRVKSVHPTSHEEVESIENIFGYLQITSACLMAFAHGANDVANAIGPLAAAYSTVVSGSSTQAGDIPTWMLALGGLGIVIGLSTWGYRVIETIGKNITELTPTRGFVAEFATAITILIATRFGFPISTTHTLVGSVMGVGFARGLEVINLGTIRDIVLSWVVTVPAGALLSVAIYFALSTIFGHG